LAASSRRSPRSSCCPTRTSSRTPYRRRSTGGSCMDSVGR
jgi:hypothetical protein